MDHAFGRLRSALKELDGYENTILWYCSDNGGLPDIGRTGGRGNKADIYEGGLKVPALIQWPAIIKEPRITRVPANTSDIFPTILEIAGIKLDSDRPLDGVSLLSVIQDESDVRSTPMGFWQYPGSGVSTPSAKWMSDLLEAQKKGDMLGDLSRLRLEDIRITPYPTDSLPGHAAWLDWPWKLHRIEDKSGHIDWELYNLAQDSLESVNVLDAHSIKVKEMKVSLEKWQRSVVYSMNGGDY